MSFEDRSNALLDLLGELDNRDLEYVLVGGYAVSAYNPRFSTDLDIVVAPNDSPAFVEFLEANGFEQIDRHAKDWYYATEVLEYEKRLSEFAPIGFDLLVNGLGCRQTNAQWSFEYLLDHAAPTEIQAGTTAVTAHTVAGGVLATAKLHSGRESDVRDVVAIVEATGVDAIAPHLHRGDPDALRGQLETVLVILDSEDLRHGYRSDFGGTAISEETIAELSNYLEEQIDQLG